MKLTPIISPLVSNFIADRTQITDLTNAFGSPLNIIFPQSIDQNIKDFQEVFKKHKINGKIYYAHKANKSLSLVKQIRYNNINIDVASEQELKNALMSGFDGSTIEATGPKNTAFLILAIQHSCLIQSDNISEIKEIVKIHKKLGIKGKTRIISRFSGFISKESRFGIDYQKYDEVISIFEESNDSVELKGFSFHLDINTSEEKIEAIEKMLLIYEKFNSKGYEVEIINIGGGFKTNYIKDEKEWNNYIACLKNSSNKDSLVWRNGKINHYEYFNKFVGAKYLNEILSARLASGNSEIGVLICELMLELAIEPGRSLLDQVGITCAKVNFIKESKSGEVLVGLDMNRSHLCSTDQEMMLDPIILYKNKPQKIKEHGVYFVGNLCLESDFIYKHKTFLPQLPEVGDIVVFVNTAAYNMDFTESNTAQQKTAKKVAVIHKNHKFYFFEDNIYNPYLHL